MKRNSSLILLVLFLFAQIFLLPSCSSAGKETTQKIASSETVFEVQLPTPLSNNEFIFLEIIDEVTGISLNPSRFQMEQKDDRSVFARIPLSNGSLIKYRYVKHGEGDTIERNSLGEQVQYRVFLVTRPAVIRDSISSWANSVDINTIGEISGYVYDQKTNAPIADVFISINGTTTVSGADGYYEITRLPIGEYILSAFHIDGLYKPFQQGAVVAENALTPASFGMQKAKSVTVTFQLRTPENTIAGAPVKIIGNTYSTGNVFGEIAGGTSIVSTRAPLMEYDGENEYHIDLELPEGIDFRYKYSLGDGFINAEHADNGDYLSRQYIVPTKDSLIKNSVFSWSKDPNQTPVTIKVTAPENTPSHDILNIQFNPFVWMQPINMWKTDKNKWMFTVYGPFDYLEKSQFRFCRNGLCGLADDEKTAGLNASGFVFDSDSLKSDSLIVYQIENWNNLATSEYSLSSFNVNSKGKDFLNSIAISKEYNPNWLPFFQWGLVDIAISGSDFLIISPKQYFKNTNHAEIEFFPAKTYSYKEISEICAYTQDAELELVLFPEPAFAEKSYETYWNDVPLTFNWWNDWLKEYKQFIKSYAVSSEILGLEKIIIGGSAIAPALPAGKLPNGSFSNTPYDMDDRWKNLIAEVREVYNGEIVFSIPDNNLESISDYKFLSSIDQILVEMDTPLAGNRNAEISEMQNRAEKFFDEELKALFDMYNKPIFIGLIYPSLDGAASGCVDSSTSCESLISSETKDNLIDLSEQADIYQVVLSEINKRDWIKGIISMGYQPTVIVQDAGTSIHGKPAADVLSYYFNNLGK